MKPYTTGCFIYVSYAATLPVTKPYIPTVNQAKATNSSLNYLSCSYNDDSTRSFCYHAISECHMLQVNVTTCAALWSLSEIKSPHNNYISLLLVLEECNIISTVIVLLWQNLLGLNLLWYGTYTILVSTPSTRMNTIWLDSH